MELRTGSIRTFAICSRMCTMSRWPNFCGRAFVPGNFCFFDIGANVGVYVLQLVQWARPGGEVVAFEPNPALLALFSESTSQFNQLGNSVEVVPSAVGAAEGRASFFSSDLDAMSRLGAPNERIAKTAKETTVAVITLDAYTAKTRVDPDWILIDIEGFEIQALLGARELIRRRRGKTGLIVEMHPDIWDSANTTKESAAEILRELRLRPVALEGQREPLEEHGIVYLEPC